MQLNDSVTAVKFISAKYAKLLEKLNIFTVKDLLTHFPYKYLNSSDVTTIKNIVLAPDFQKNYLVEVSIDTFNNTFIRGGRSLQRAQVSDSTGNIECVWFNQRFLKSILVPGSKFFLYGKIVKKGSKFTMYPSIYEELVEDKENVHLGRIVPEYSLTDGVTKKWFRNRVKAVIDELASMEIPDELKDFQMSELTLKESLNQAHFPDNSDILAKAIRTLSLYELTEIQLKLEEKRAVLKKYKAPYSKIDVETQLKSFYQNLPFTPTADQEKVISDLVKKLENKQILNELIQGDVGSGKTLISLAMAFLMAKMGFQTVILVPTTILAKQHFETYSKILKDEKIGIELVTSENKNTESKDILIGTSAILARKINLVKNLGLIIVDEQHRFGVGQREELLQPIMNLIKSDMLPHFINMTATPIPRTIAQVFFGDLDVDEVKTKPQGRLPIKSLLVPEAKRGDSYEWIRQKAKEGDQIYWMCSLVEDSEKLQAKSAEQTYKELKKYFKELRIGLLHGQLKPKEKVEVMEDFANHNYDILVCTTVIEVGIDVPNATIIVVENAERFGLAQLHQIRGRVGRGDKQSWCLFFYSDSASTESLERLNFLANTNDGLKIAEFDLQQRGPGEIYGTRQSGIPNLKIARLDNLSVIQKSRELAQTLYNQGIQDIELFK